MEITGRLVADATVRTTGNEKEVTGFRVAVNRTYKSQGERKQETSYIDCSYWRGGKVAPFLIKGMIVHLSGFMTAEPWVNRDGEAQASLKFRTEEITMLSKSATPSEQSAKVKQAGDKKGVLTPSKEFN